MLNGYNKVLAKVISTKTPKESVFF